MQISSLMDLIQPSQANAASTTASPPATPSAGGIDTNTFLKLLTTQLQAQDPLNPVNPTDFVTQLAQFSSLEQLIGIRQDMDSALTNPSGTASNPTPSPAPLNAAPAISH